MKAHVKSASDQQLKQSGLFRLADTTSLLEFVDTKLKNCRTKLKAEHIKLFEKLALENVAGAFREAYTSKGESYGITKGNCPVCRNPTPEIERQNLFSLPLLKFSREKERYLRRKGTVPLNTTGARLSEYIEIVNAEPERISDSLREAQGAWKLVETFYEKFGKEKQRNPQQGHCRFHHQHGDIKR